MKSKQQLHQTIAGQRTYIQHLENHLLSLHSQIFKSIQTLAQLEFSQLPFLQSGPHQHLCVTKSSTSVSSCHVDHIHNIAVPSSSSSSNSIGITGKNNDTVAQSLENISQNVEKSSFYGHHHHKSVNANQKNELKIANSTHQLVGDNFDHEKSKEFHKERSEKTNFNTIADEKKKYPSSSTCMSPRQSIDSHITEGAEIDIFDMSFWKQEIEKVLLSENEFQKSSTESSSLSTIVRDEGMNQKIYNDRRDGDHADDDEFSHENHPSNEHKIYQLSDEEAENAQNHEADQCIKKRKRAEESSTRNTGSSISDKITNKRGRKQKQLLNVDAESDDLKRKDLWLQREEEVHEQFAQFLGQKFISRTDAYKRVWQYIKKNKLQRDESNMNKIYCDGTLASLLTPEQNPIPNMWTLNKLILNQFKTNPGISFNSTSINTTSSNVISTNATTTTTTTTNNDKYNNNSNNNDGHQFLLDSISSRQSEQNCSHQQPLNYGTTEALSFSQLLIGSPQNQFFLPQFRPQQQKQHHQPFLQMRQQNNIHQKHKTYNNPSLSPLSPGLSIAFKNASPLSQSSSLPSSQTHPNLPSHSPSHHSTIGSFSTSCSSQK